MYHQILMPLDGSERADKILPHVEELARRYKTKDEIIDEELLDEYRRLNDETESIGLVKLPAGYFNSV